MPAPCRYCGKDCGNDYNAKKHEKACFKRPKDPPKPVSGVGPVTPGGTAPPAPSPSLWPTYRAPGSAPAQSGGVQPAGGGRVVSSGMWKTFAALENAFLSRGKVIVTDEQDAAMDQNLQACVGASGKPVSPVWALIVGIFSLFIVPLITEFAPVIKEAVGKWWDKQAKKKEDKKNDELGSQPSAPGPNTVG